MLHLIKVFEKVIDQGSFSQAAKVLKVAPSSVARAIDNLEQELGVALFKRSTRQLVLTDEGRQFKSEAINLVNHANSVIQSLKRNGTKPEGRLRVSVFETFGRLKISPLLSKFLEKYPKVSLEFDLDNRMVDLNQEDVDIAIRIGRPIDSRLKARKLLSNDTVICLSPNYKYHHGEPNSPDELVEHNCLTLNTNRQIIYWYLKKNDSVKRIPVKGSLTSTGGTPLLDSVLAGSGVAQLPYWMVEHYLSSGALIPCLNDWKSYINEDSNGMVYAVYRNTNFINPNIRAFIDFLVNHLSE